MKLELVQLLTVVFLHQYFINVESSSGHDSTQCGRLDDMPTQCAEIFQGNVSYNENLLTDTLDLLGTVEDSLNSSCVNTLTALACYYIYTPCHAARGTRLPLCPDQCSKLKHSLDICSEALLNTSNGSSSFMDLVAFTEQLNCTQPDSFMLPLSPLMVDSEDCVTLYASSNERDSNRIAEIIVLTLLVAVGSLLIVLLLVILCVVIVCLRKRKRTRKSKVACIQQQNNVTTLRRLDSPNPSALVEKVSSEEEVNVPNDVQVARMITDRKRRHYVSLYEGSFIPYQHLKLHNVIGEGAFGKVSEGVWKDPATNIEKRVAIKTLRSFSSEQQLNTLFTESRLMRDFDHPNVMKFLGMCFDAPEGYPYIILPYMSNGSLLEYLKLKSNGSNNTSGYPEGLELPILFQFCLDIVDGMVYLVQQKFVHRDLAARNCMVSETMTIMIGDFGLAEDLYNPAQKQSVVRQPIKWMPPESLKDGVSNERTDMWSYGVTCWEVFSLGRSPYPGIENHEILQHISSGGRLKKPSLCPDKLYNIVCGCWNYNPGDRPSFEDMAWTLRQYWNTLDHQQQHNTT